MENTHKTTHKACSLNGIFWGLPIAHDLLEQLPGLCASTTASAAIITASAATITALCARPCVPSSCSEGDSFALVISPIALLIPYPPSNP